MLETDELPRLRYLPRIRESPSHLEFSGVKLRRILVAVGTILQRNFTVAGISRSLVGVRARALRFRDERKTRILRVCGVDLISLANDTNLARD